MNVHAQTESGKPVPGVAGMRSPVSSSCNAISLLALVLLLCGGAFVTCSRAEMLLVPANTSIGVTSEALNANVLYSIEVSGTYSWGGGDADAEWILSGVSGPPLEVYPLGGFTEDTDALDLLIDGMAVKWAGTADGTNWSAHTFSPTHAYRVKVVGAGQPLTFAIADQTPFGPGYYSDNSGSLTVNITACPAVIVTGITHSNSVVELALSNLLNDVTYTVERTSDLRLTNAWCAVTNLNGVTGSHHWSETIGSNCTSAFYRVTVLQGTTQ